MQSKWTYKVETIKPPVFAKMETKAEYIADILNRRGLEGWELINAPSLPMASYFHYFQVIFKKPL